MTIEALSLRVYRLESDLKELVKLIESDRFRRVYKQLDYKIQELLDRQILDLNFDFINNWWSQNRSVLDMSVTDLRRRASVHKIKGYHLLNKITLQTEILNVQYRANS